MKSKRSLSVIILIVLLVNFTFVAALTGSMGNAKMTLYPEVNGFITTTIEKSILTKNVNDVPIKINLEVGEGEDFLELVDKEYVLDPGTEKKAEFLIKVRKAGTYNGRILVKFSPVEGKDPGVGLSSTITVIAKKAGDYEETADVVDNTEENGNAGKGQGEGNVNVFGGNEPETGKSFGIPLKWILMGSSFVLLVILIGLGYVFLMNADKKGARKSSGNKRFRRK